MKIEFNYIRNQIRKYSLGSVLSHAMKRLKYLERNPSKIYPLWNIFTLIRWAYIYAGEKYPPVEINDSLTDKLLRHIEELSDSYRADGLSNKEKFPKYISAISKQQLWLQSEFHISIIYRQMKLFLNIKSKYDIDSSFKKLTGLKILDFLTGCFLTETYLKPQLINNSLRFNGFFPIDYFKNLKDILGEDNSECFLKLLSIGTKESIEFLKSESKKLSKGLFQAYDTAILSRFPFIKINGAETIIHKSIFTHTINFYVYDSLKSTDSRFPEEFGKRMERYIELGLKEISVNYITESQIKKQHPNSRKQVDFILDSKILIESKAIELKSLPAIIPDNEVLTKSLKDSIIKAYSQQMLTVCNTIKTNKEYFGIIITYKQLEIGNGKICWDTFLKEATKEFCSENGLDMTILPPQNLFIIDLQTWDEIVQIIKDGKTTLENLLVKVRESDNSPETTKFFLSMHLEDYRPYAFDLSYILDVQNELKFEPKV